MADRVTRFNVQFEVSGDGRVRASFDELERGSKRARDAANEVGRDWEAVGRRIGSAIRVGAAALGTAFVGAMGLVIKSTIEAEQVQAQLEARLRSTGGAAGLTRDELLSMASGLQNVTTIGDEAIVSAQNLLLTFTKIGRDVFPDALETVLDMSIAMDQGLKESAIQLGKALNDPIQGITALTRVGVQFTDAQKEQIEAMVEAGNVADAQRVILAELETQMGGSARAARDTLGGAFTALQNAAGDLLEGDSGGDGIRGVTRAVNDLTDILQDPATREAFAGMVSGIVSVTEALAVMAVESANAWEAMQRWTTFSFGGTRQITDLQQIRFEMEKVQGVIDEIDNGPTLDNYIIPGLNVLQSVQRDAAVKRLVELRELQEKSLLLFGDPGIEQGNTTQSSTSIKSSDPRFANVNAQAESRGTEENTRTKRTNTAATRENREEKELQRRAEAALSAEIAEVNRIIDDQVEEYQRLAEAEREAQQQKADYIQALRDEYNLRNLNNAEARTAIDLARLAAPATAEEAAEILRLNQAMEQQERNIDFMDTFRDGLVDLGQTAVYNFGKAGDAAKQFIDTLASLITQRILERWVEQLFGSRGSTGAQSGGGGLINGILGALFGGGGGGASAGSLQGFGNNVDNFTGGASRGGGGGGWLGTAISFVAGLFGGGLAGGGPTQAGRLYRVNEVRPEVYEFGDQAYLMAGGRNGRVVPNPSFVGAGGGDTYNVNVTVPQGTRRWTATQMANETVAGINRSARLRG